CGGGKGDLPEQVVGRQEHQVPAEVRVALDQVVLVGRRVLLMTRKDDQVVVVSEEVAAGDVLEVQVSEEVDAAAGAEPLDDRLVEVREAIEEPRIEGGPADVDRAEG